MDYFFRGKLEVKIQWNMDSQDYTLEITNKSGTALKGGAFTLYADDFIGTRSGVSLEVDHGSWNANSVLENDEMITATF